MYTNPKYSKKNEESDSEETCARDSEMTNNINSEKVPKAVEEEMNKRVDTINKQLEESSQKKDDDTL